MADSDSSNDSGSFTSADSHFQQYGYAEEDPSEDRDQQFTITRAFLFHEDFRSQCSRIPSGRRIGWIRVFLSTIRVFRRWKRWALTKLIGRALKKTTLVIASKFLRELYPHGDPYDRIHDELTSSVV